MYQMMRALHPGLTILLLLLYTLLAWRWWTMKGAPPSPLIKTLAHSARLMLLLLYLSGFMLFNGYRLPVSELHHYASLLPVAIIFLFQFLPSLFRRPLPEKWQSVMWMCLFLTIVVIAVSTHLY